MPKGTYTYLVKAARYDSKDRVFATPSNEVSAGSIYNLLDISLTKLNSNSVTISRE